MTSPTPTLVPTVCAVCRTIGNAKQAYAAAFDPETLDPALFSARRPPDRVHFRWVKCNRCGLLRSDPMIEANHVARLYQKSGFHYGAEAENLTWTYGRYLQGLKNWKKTRQSLLEIGCGSGFFLEKALKCGYGRVRGVEPSREAVAQASPLARPSIACTVMREGFFSAEEFDVICMFQLLDHIPDPGRLLQECRRILKPGGLILCLNHNSRAISARLLKERSPIVDIEHTYLFDPQTIRKLFEGQEFQVLRVARAWNRCSLNYLGQLLLPPCSGKDRVLEVLKKGRLGSLALPLPLGNLYLIAHKAESIT